MPWLVTEGKRKKFSLCRNLFFICMAIDFLSVSLFRSIAITLSSLFAIQGFAQVKDRDYTRQWGSQFKRHDGGSKLFGSKTNSRISSKRIHVSQIPFHYSRFGGKRFPVNRVEILERREFPATTLTFPTVHRGARVGANGRSAFANASKVSSTSTMAQEFRDQYHESLDKRVEQWMEKVNNLSMADVNRYQFRRGRSTTPGFPVQKAGGQEPSDSSGKSLLPATLQGARSLSEPKVPPPSRYRLGPMKIKTDVSGRGSPPSSSIPKASRARPSVSSPAPVPQPQLAAPRSSSRSKYPTIRLGPRKITVRAK